MKVEALESELDELALRIARRGLSSEELVRSHLEHLSRQIARKRPARTMAESVLKCCPRTYGEASTAGSEGLRCVHFHELNGEVTCTRNRACAAMDVAAAAIDEAAHAALEAWLAEKGAAKAAHADFPPRTEGMHEE